MGEFTDLKYEYHDSWLKQVEIGPRREVSLVMYVWTARQPGEMQPRLPITVRLRFGGIENFDEVASFFGRLDSDRIDALYHDPKRSPKPGDLHVIVELDRFGSVTVHCRNVTVQSVPDED